MTELQLKVGTTYRGKRPHRLFLAGFNDRTILYISPMGVVQYDGPAIRTGRHYPTTTREKFLRWAKCEVDEVAECDAQAKKEK